MLNTSITPVREALKLLGAEGYVIGNSFRGATVAPFDKAATQEMLALRILLETRLVKGAVERAKSEEIGELHELAEEFARANAAGENEVARAANYRFHHRMFDIADMPQTLHFVQLLWARYPFDVINKIAGRVGRAAKEHDDLLQAFIATDTGAAMLATRCHIESGWMELQQAMQGAIADAGPADVS